MYAIGQLPGESVAEAGARASENSTWELRDLCWSVPRQRAQAIGF